MSNINSNVINYKISREENESQSKQEKMVLIKESVLECIEN
jgi:hypothetical protein